MASVLERVRSMTLSHAAVPATPRPVKATTPAPRVAASVATSTSLIPVSTFSSAGAIYDRSTAIRLPTLARARNIHVNVVAVLPMRYWKRTADPVASDQQLQLLDWMVRPDPHEIPALTLSCTTDDLFFHERAYWRIRERFPSSGFPSSFQWMPYVECAPTYSNDLMTLQSLEWRSQRIPMEDVVEFRGIIAGVLNVGSDAITTALKLERAAQRFADFNLPAGQINIPLQAGDEPHETSELNAIGDNFDARRSSSATAVLEGATYENPDWDAEKMGLIPNRQQSSLDLARLGSVPPWVVGAPNPDGMTYSNAGWSRRDLVDFGSAGFMTTIVQTLSGPNVIPPGTYLDFDLEGWIALANDLGVSVPPKPVQP